MRHTVRRTHLLLPTFKFTGTFEMCSQVNPTLIYSQVDAGPNSSILTCGYRTVLENRRQCRQMLGQVLSGAGKLNLPKYAGYANPVSFRHRIAADGFVKTILNYILYLERAHVPGANSNIIMPALSFSLSCSLAWRACCASYTARRILLDGLSI